jgi:hypothetical protein
MSTGAWIMLVVGSLFLYGGLAYCLILVKVRGRSDNYLDLAEEEADQLEKHNDPQPGEAQNR